MTHEERLEMTYKRFPKMRSPDYKSRNTEICLLPEPDIHGDTCPNCGSKTLIHESGCVKCSYCAWSACG